MGTSATETSAEPTRRAVTSGALAALLGASITTSSSAQQGQPIVPETVLLLDSTTAMVAAPVGNKELVALVLGYSAPNDGGGGLFIWDPSSSENENGGTMFESSRTSTGRWLRLET